MSRFTLELYYAVSCEVAATSQRPNRCPSPSKGRGKGGGPHVVHRTPIARGIDNVVHCTTRAGHRRQEAGWHTTHNDNQSEPGHAYLKHTYLEES